MTRSKNSNFGTNSGGTIGGVYTCRICKKKTRETGECESNVELCAACYDYAGWENSHTDGHGDGMGSEDCPVCAEEAAAEALAEGIAAAKGFDLPPNPRPEPAAEERALDVVEAQELYPIVEGIAAEERAHDEAEISVGSYCTVVFPEGVYTHGDPIWWWHGRVVRVLDDLADLPYVQRKSLVRAPGHVETHVFQNTWMRKV